MKSLGYLVVTQFKNQLRELLHRPSRLITAIFVVAMLAVVLFAGGQTPQAGEEMLPLSLLIGVVVAFYAVMFIMIARSGIISGASFYTMADVSMLFPSPIPTRTILLYGLVRQLGTSVLLGFFLIFQYSWLHNLFGLELPGLIAILAGYAVTIFTAQITSMALYSVTAGDDRRRAAAKKLFAGAVVLALAGAGVPMALGSGGLLDRAAGAASSPFTLLIPCGGWLGQAVSTAMGGNPLLAAGGLLLAAAYIAAVLVLILRTDSDFYEDVLQATEVSHSAITAKKEGKMQDVVPKHVKVGKIGIGRGSGADAFYYKHKLENRRARIFLLDGMSLIMAVCLLFFGYLMKDAGVAVVFAFAAYLQFFTTITGRWIKELTLPYVYMVPQPAFRKLLAVCREQVRSMAAEAVLVMVLLGLLLGASPLVIAAMVAARIGYGLLYMAGNILVERVLGGMVNKILIFSLYFLILLLVAAPGIILGIVSGILLGTAAGLAATMVWNLLASAVIAFACRDILNCAELNNK